MVEDRKKNTPGPGPRVARDIALDMFRLYGRSFVRMLTTAAVVMVPLLLAGRAAFGADLASILLRTPDNTPAQLPDAVLGGIAAYAFLYLVGTLAAVGAIAEEAARGLLDSDVSISRAFGVSIRRLPSMLGAGLLTALTAGLPLAVAASMATSILTIADVVLLVLTSVLATYVAIRLMFAVFVALLEQVGPLEAVSRSWRLVSGSWLRSFALLVLVSFLVGVIQLALEYAGSMAPAAAAGVSAVAVAPLTTIGNLLIYFDLRVRKEGYSAAVLAAELDTLTQQDRAR